MQFPYELARRNRGESEEFTKKQGDIVLIYRPNDNQDHNNIIEALVLFFVQRISLEGSSTKISAQLEHMEYTPRPVSYDLTSLNSIKCFV